MLPNYSKHLQHHYFYSVKTHRRKTLSGRIAIKGLKLFNNTFFIISIINNIKLVHFVDNCFGFNKSAAREFV